MFLKLGPKLRSHDVPIAVLVPNFVTTLALCSGLASLHFILAEEWHLAMMAIVAAAVFDVLDGGAARLLRVTTKFGAMLDSLSDFLAFGVAPAMLLHQWVLKAPTVKLIDTLGLMAVMVFAVCSALRLARFTSLALSPAPTSTPPPPTTKGRASLFFVGMPTPAGAAAALVPAFLAGSKTFREMVPNTIVPEWIIAIYTLTIALLMVSRIPMFGLKGLRISRRSVTPLLVAMVVVVVLMIREPWLTLAGLSLSYLLTIPWAMVMHRRTKYRGIKRDAANFVAKVG